MQSSRCELRTHVSRCGEGVSDYGCRQKGTHTHGTNENKGSSFGVAVLIEIVLAQPRRWEGICLGMNAISKLLTVKHTN